jgi:hypothetical protein
MDKLKGSKFNMQVKCGVFGFDDCSQIEIAVFNAKTPADRLVYLKVADAEQPDALPVESNSGNQLWLDITVDTSELPVGQYLFEMKRTVTGDAMPIIKTPVELFKLKTSQTS